MRDIILLLAWLATLPLAISQPFVGVMLWAWTALLDPNYYVYGFMSGVQLNKVVSAFTLLFTFTSREKKRFKLDATTTLILLLLIEGAISYMLSDYKAQSFVIFDKFWKICVLCALINAMTYTRLRLYCLVGICAIGLGFHGVIEGLKFIKSGGAHHVEGLPSLGDNNQFALAMLMITPFIFYMSRQATNRFVKWGWLVAAGLTCLSVVSTYSRGGLIGMATLGIALLVTNKNKLRTALLIAVVTGGVFATAPPGWFDRIATIQDANSDDSFQGRVLAWRVSYAIALSHPIFGAGFDAVQTAPLWRAYLPTIPGEWNFDPQFTNHPHAAHSIFLQVLGDLGFPGLGLFLAMIGMGFRNASYAIRFAKRRPDTRWVLELAQMFRLTFLVYVVSGAALSMAYFEFFYIALSMSAVLVRLCKEMRAVEFESSETSGAAAPPLAATNAAVDKDLVWLPR